MTSTQSNTAFPADLLVELDRSRPRGLRTQLEHGLRQAIARNQLRLVYQPQKKIHTDEIVGLEALLRWNHPTRGQISPSIFIPIAEESGAILQIGEWVLRTAC